MGETNQGAPSKSCKKGPPARFTLRHTWSFFPPHFLFGKQWGPSATAEQRPMQQYKQDRSFSNTNTHSSSGFLPFFPLPPLQHNFPPRPLFHSDIINTVGLECTDYNNELWQGRRREGSTVRVGEGQSGDKTTRSEWLKQLALLTSYRALS